MPFHQAREWDDSALATPPDGRKLCPGSSKMCVLCYCLGEPLRSQKSRENVQCESLSNDLQTVECMPASLNVQMLFVNWKLHCRDQRFLFAVACPVRTSPIELCQMQKPSRIYRRHFKLELSEVESAASETLSSSPQPSASTKLYVTLVWEWGCFWPLGGQKHYT